MDREVTRSAAEWFMLRFGVEGPRAGRGYIRKILVLVEEHGAGDSKKYINEVAKADGVTPEAVMAGVSRWLRSTWADEFLKNQWLSVVGVEDTEKPPTPSRAIQLIYDAYLAWRK